MKVEFIRPWGRYSIGQVISPPDGQASEMIRRGIVAKVRESEEPKRQKAKVKVN